jgi:integral membrane sensor domain MASE1
VTPLFGFVIALLAGMLFRPPRVAVAAALPPWLAILALQTWHLAAGLGVNPSSTVYESSYWVVQLLVLAPTLGVAAGISDWRSRRRGNRAEPRTSLKRDATLAGIGTLASAAIGFVLLVAFGTASHPQSGGGDIPISGVIGVGSLLLSCVIVVVAEIYAWLSSRGERHARPAAGTTQ